MQRSQRKTERLDLAQKFCTVVLAAFVVNVNANDFAFTPTGMFPNFHWNVSIDGSPAQLDPPIVLLRGQTYTIHLSGLAGIHSFYINTQSGIGRTNAYTGGGLSDNGTTTDTPVGTPITFTVPQSAPDILFYNCGVHSSMAGTITVDGIFTDGFETKVD
jgi:hypothetical protein